MSEKCPLCGGDIYSCDEFVRCENTGACHYSETAEGLALRVRREAIQKERKEIEGIIKNYAIPDRGSDTTKQESDHNSFIHELLSAIKARGGEE